MILWGRLIGGLLGIPAGVFGIILGFLVGWLVDQTIKVSRQNASLQAFLTGSGSIYGTKLHGELFVAAVAVMMGVASADGSATIRQVEMMKDWLSHRFRVTERGALGLSKVVDEAYRLRGDLDIGRACSALAKHFDTTDSTELVRFLLDLAEADIHGITYNARQLIREVAFLLGLSSEALSQVEVRPTKLDEDACSLLGLPTDADAEEVRRVYRLLASQFHPDVNSVLSPDQVRQSNEAFVRIKEAYERLMSQLGEH